MKIVHLCLCGVFDESYAYQDNLLSKYHKLMGHDVTIIAPTYSKYDNNGGCAEHLSGVTTLMNGCKLIRIRPLISSFRLNLHFHLFHDYSKALIAERPDFVFVHGLNSWSYLKLSKISRCLPNTKFAFDNHADYVNSATGALSKFLNGFLVRRVIVKKLMRLSDFFYGVTPSRCTFMREVYGVPDEKIHLLVMGADDESLKLEQKESLKKAVRQKYKISDDDFLIVTGGKIGEKKNIHKIIEAVATIPEKRIKVLFFGSISDSLKDVIDSYISDRVLYVGWVPSNQVYQYFYAADLIVFPGLHSVLWEQAVATQVPCAFTKLVGFDHVNFNNNCVFLEKQTVEYYRMVISNLFKDKEKYHLLLNNSQGEGVKQFLYSNIAEKVIIDSFPKSDV